MRTLPFIVAVLAASSLSAFSFDDAFRQAQTEYDNGRYKEAVACYEGILNQGAGNVEIHYNMANAMFKAGDLPNAVWHYRTAWYKAPRDPDINANLHFALNAAGAVEPAHSITRRFFTSLSSNGWMALATASYLLLSAVLFLSIVLRNARYALLKLSLLPALLLLMAGCGWWEWRTFRIRPEAVVIRSGTTALFGPMDGSTAHYKLPQGALVRQCASDPKGWEEVEYDGKKGWIKTQDIMSLSP